MITEEKIAALCYKVKDCESAYLNLVGHLCTEGSPDCDECSYCHFCSLEHPFSALSQSVLAELNAIYHKMD